MKSCIADGRILKFVAAAAVMAVTLFGVSCGDRETPAEASPTYDAPTEFGETPTGTVPIVPETSPTLDAPPGHRGTPTRTVPDTPDPRVDKTIEEIKEWWVAVVNVQWGLVANPAAGSTFVWGLEDSFEACVGSGRPSAADATFPDLWPELLLVIDETVNRVCDELIEAMAATGGPIVEEEPWVGIAAIGAAQLDSDFLALLHRYPFLNSPFSPRWHEQMNQAIRELLP